MLIREPRILLTARHSGKPGNPGFVALDDLNIKTAELNGADAACEPLPAPPPPPSTEPPCPGQFQCRNGACLALEKVCNFKVSRYDCLPFDKK